MPRRTGRCPPPQWRAAACSLPWKAHPASPLLRWRRPSRSLLPATGGRYAPISVECLGFGRGRHILSHGAAFRAYSFLDDSFGFLLGHLPEVRGQADTPFPGGGLQHLLGGVIHAHGYGGTHL